MIWPAVIAFLFALSPLADSARLWGINHLRFLPASVVIIFLTTTILCFIPQVSGAINKKLNETHTGYVNLPRTQKALRSILILIGCGAVFYLVRTPTAFLGDGYMRATELMRGFGHLPLQTEPLTAILHFAFYKSMGTLLGLDGIASISLFSAIAGGIFLLAVINIIKPLPNIEFSPLLFIVGLGGIQFYFGYVESYGLMFAGLAISIWYAYRYLSRGTHFLTAVSIYAITCLAHFASLFIMPAFVVFMLYAMKDKGLPSWKKVFGIGWLAIVLIGFAYFNYFYTASYGVEERELLISLSPDGYWLFSINHIIDILNSLLLTAMPALILLPFLIRRSAWSGFKGREILFTILMLLGAGAFLLLFNPELGFARDWDLFAGTGLTLSLIALALVYKNRKWIASHRSYLHTAALLPVVLTASFIAVNQSKAQSVERFEYVLSLYEERSAHGYEVLGNYFRVEQKDRDDIRKSISYYRKAFEAKENPRYLLSVAKIYYNLIKTTTDQSLMRQLTATLENYSRAALQLDSTSAAAYSYIMQARSARGEVDSAMLLTDSILKYTKPEDKPEFWSMRARIFFRNKMLDSCAQNYLRALELDPDMTIIYHQLGRVYMNMDQNQKARECFNEFLKREPESELIPQTENFLHELER